MAWYDPDPVVRRQATLMVGVVVGAVLIGCVWLVAALMNRDGETPVSTPRADAVLGTESVAPREAPVSGADRCQRVFRAQAAPLRTAIASMEGWEVHVAAMNQLVAGEITLDQATAFWNETRRQAAGRLGEYDDAVAVFRERGVRCMSPENPAAKAAGPACVEAVAARAQTLRRAAVALGTWRMHVHHMEMLRAGELSPARALVLWNESWRAGVREIDRYRLAAQRSLGQQC